MTHPRKSQSLSKVEQIRQNVELVQKSQLYLRPSIQQLKFVASDNADTNKGLQKIRIEGKGVFDNVKTSDSVSSVTSRGLQNCPLNRVPRQINPLPLVYPQACTNLSICIKSPNEDSTVSFSDSKTNSLTSYPPYNHTIKGNESRESQLEVNFLPPPYRTSTPMRTIEPSSIRKCCSRDAVLSNQPSVSNSTHILIRTQILIQPHIAQNVYSNYSFTSHSDLRLKLDPGIFYKSQISDVLFLRDDATSHLKPNFLATDKQMKKIAEHAKESLSTADEILPKDPRSFDHDLNSQMLLKKEIKTEESSILKLSTVIFEDKSKTSKSESSFYDSSSSSVFNKDDFIQKVKTGLDLQSNFNGNYIGTKATQRLGYQPRKTNLVSKMYSFTETSEIFRSRIRDAELLHTSADKRISFENVACKLNNNQHSTSPGTDHKLTPKATRSLCNVGIVSKTTCSNSERTGENFFDDLSCVSSVEHTSSSSSETSCEDGDLLYKDAVVQVDSTASLSFDENESLLLLYCRSDKSTQVDSNTSLSSVTFYDKETQINSSSSSSTTLQSSNSDLELRHEICKSSIILEHFNERTYQVSSSSISKTENKVETELNSVSGGLPDFLKNCKISPVVSDTCSSENSSIELELSVYSIRICEHFTEVGIQVELGLESLSYLRQSKIQ